MAKTTQEKIELKMAEKEQLENELKWLMQQHKAEERKARTSRLCKRHGLLESILPDTIPLTEDNFKLFLEKTVANEYGRRTLAALKAGQEKEAADNGAETAAQGGGNPADKPARATQPGADIPAAKPANPAQSGGNAPAEKLANVTQGSGAGSDTSRANRAMQKE
jgi:hypothetical protein